MFRAIHARFSALVRNPADTRQVVLAIMGPPVLVAPFALSAPIAVEILIWIAVWTFIYRHNYILHNHVHCPFMASRRLNRLIGGMLGFCTGMTVGQWKITHVHGHHAEHKLKYLPSRRYIEPLKVDGKLPFSVRSGIVHALKTAPPQWIIPTRVMVAGAFGRSKLRRKFYRFHLLELLTIYAIAGGLTYIDPWKGLFYFGLVYALVYVISRYVDYLTHASSHGASKLSIANICLDPGYNKAFWNFGYHVAHHIKPSAHWTALPSLHRSLAVSPEPGSTAIETNMFGLFAPPAFHWHRVRDAGLDKGWKG